MPTLSTPLLVLLGIAAAAVAHGVYLWWLVQRRNADADACARALGDAPPGSGNGRWVWHSIPPDCTETKLVLAYDSEPRHVALQYPAIRPARHVLFSGGRLHLMTEEAFERTLAADVAVREKAGLDPADDDG